MGGLTLPEGTTKWLGNLLVTFIGACQWMYAFILTACVGMAGGPYSPEIEIDFSGREAAFRTVFLLAFVGLSWFCAYSFTFRRRWAWYHTWVLGIFLLAIGLYAHWTSQGTLEAFLGRDSLRKTTGFIVALLAVSALVLLPLPPVRRQFFRD
jgi:hypothetical protein